MRRTEPEHTESNATTTTPRNPPPPQSQRRVRVLSGAAAVAAVLLIAVLAATLFGSRGGSSGPPPIPSVLTIDLAKDKLYCANSPTWSPDGTRIALIVYKNKDECFGQNPVVAIYDARTGRLVRTIDPVHLLSTFGQIARDFTAVSWSPEGQTLAVAAEIIPESVTVSPSGVLTSSTSPWGLLLVPVQSGAARFIASTDLDLQQPYDRTIWDVASGGVAGILDQPLPQALSYRWTGDGHLVADAPLPASSLLGTFSGSPTSQVGGATFSRWHSGTIGPSPSRGPDGAVDYTSPPADWTLLTTGPIWSPGGRFFTMLRYDTRLTGAPLDPAQCANSSDDVPFGQTCTQPAIALPDRGLAAVLAAAQAGRPGAPIGNTPSTNKWTSVSVDWRPDGKALAAILPGDGFGNQVVDNSSSVRVTLYSTATGQPLTTLETPHPTKSYGLTASAWSPDGAQFALIDTFDTAPPRPTPASTPSAGATPVTGTGSASPFAFSTVITIWGASSLAALPR